MTHLTVYIFLCAGIPFSHTLVSLIYAMHFSSVILIKVQKSNNIYNCAIHNSYFDFKWTHINHRLSTIEWWSSKAITIKRAPITSNQSFPIRTHYRSYNDVTKITLNFRSIASNWLLKKRHTKINLHISIEKWNWRKTIFSQKKKSFSFLVI